MNGLYLSRGLFPHDFLRPTVQSIVAGQDADGGIHWHDTGHLDTWDHVEAAMGLSIGGERHAAERAYAWLKERQLPDGSWWAAYRAGKIDNRDRRETNFVAYVATGVWHHYLVSGDCRFLADMWPMVSKAIDFVVSLQTPHGDILWAVDGAGKPKDDSLLTGCSSICKSLECAINIAVTLGQDRRDWREARDRLVAAISGKPERFDRTWESKARFSMDWFYPVLSGALAPGQARARLAGRWHEFVREGLGCKCVNDQPWVTVAESCELVMALLAAGDHARAVRLYSWLHQWRANSGAYWMGYQYIEDIVWPNEQPTWTAGAILLAADALTEYTPASRLFTSVNLLAAPAERSSRRLSTHN